MSKDVKIEIESDGRRVYNLRAKVRRGEERGAKARSPEKQPYSERPYSEYV